VILDLVRVVPRGSEIKRQVDEAIDRCSVIINLREIIYVMHKQSETKPQYLKRALDFLERYVM
jgi:hypothetical protein